MSYSYPNADHASSDGIWTPSTGSTRYQRINTFPGTPDYVAAYFDVLGVNVDFYTYLESVVVLPESATLRIHLTQQMTDAAVLKDYYLVDGASTVIASGTSVNLAIPDLATTLTIPLTINSVTVIGTTTTLRLVFRTDTDSTVVAIYGIQLEWAAPIPPPTTATAVAALSLMASWPQ